MTLPALEQLVPLVYEELRRIAHRQLRGERSGHTLDTTALVHEAWLKLNDLERMEWRDRNHFVAMAARVMRRVLVDYARSRGRDKRGNGAVPLPLAEALDVPAGHPRDLTDLDEALVRLEQLNPRLCRVVEYRCFAGMSVEETATALGTSPATVKRDWTLACDWLNRELRRGVEPMRRQIQQAAAASRDATAEAFDRFRRAVKRYALGKEIGRGGMAVVFAAEDLERGGAVAIKVLKPTVAQLLGPDRFLREIEIAGRLLHPNILPLHASGVAADLPYYVMPYVAGETLRDRLRREGRLPVADALRIAGDVAAALAHAHALGLVHRDIKPENILFHEGRAVLTDFGIARPMINSRSGPGTRALTASGMILGTVAYMSPEQAAGRKDLDGRSDIYSLGGLLHEMLTGTVAGAAPGPLPSDIPAGLAKVVERAMAHDPADRFPTATELGEALST